MKKIFSIIALSLTLTACATTAPNPPPIIIAPTPPVNPPKADPIVMAPVQWKVYSSDELKALAAKNGGSFVLFTLDTDNFKHLNGNLVDIKRFIEQQNAIIDYLTKAANAPSEAAAKNKVSEPVSVKQFLATPNR